MKRFTTGKARIKKITALVACSMTISMATSVFAAESNNTLTWDMAEEIRTHISNPIFPDYKVNINDFGAIPNDNKLDTEAIQSAIKHVNENGGGTVVVPKGTYDSGAIELLSNVNLFLEDEETLIKYTTEMTEENFPVVYSHWEATPCYNYSALIYAKDQENIALTGKGTLDGQASEDTWWGWKHAIEDAWSQSKTSLQEKASNELRDMNNNGVPVSERIFGDGKYLRPNFIQTINCNNVLFEGVTLHNSPMWQVNPVLCENVTVRDMTLNSHGYNNDGVDPESCNYVLIENNTFDTGDDCIAIKSGRDRDGRELNTPSQNILVFNNTFADGHGGIAMGSEMSGSIRNVFADGNHFDSPNLTYPLRFKTNAKRGGVIENVYLRNSDIATVNQATCHATMLYAEGRNGNYIPSFRNIVIENVKANGGSYGIFMEAFEESPITGLVFRNVEINNVGTPIRAMNWGDDVIMDNVTINGQSYPRPTESRILGIPTEGASLEADALLIAGDTNNLTYTWYLADSKDGNYSEVSKGKTFSVPSGTKGKFLKVSAADKDGNTDTSIAYKVLQDTAVAGIAENSEVAVAAARLASKGVIDENTQIDTTQEVTRLELAKMIANIWGLTAPSKEVEIADMDKSNQDYDIVAAVVAKNMLPLVDGKFNPNGTITREEMGTVAMMSCGVSYKNASTTFETTYTDGKDITNVYLTDIERGTTLGFWNGTARGYFSPKQNMTYAMTLTVLDRVSDFAGK